MEGCKDISIEAILAHVLLAPLEKIFPSSEASSQLGKTSIFAD